ncbi:MAG: Tad domain-containing protein, partial [Acidimicrobiia bacterium]|nr:Tad domain-containing protein [Acidimicrobiia bacterium]
RPHDDAARATTAHRRMQARLVNRARCSGDGGFVLAWAAMMLTTLLAFAGFGVDLGIWYLQADRLQKASDAAALGGVVFMPGDFATAEETALEILEGHGYADDDRTDITISPGELPNQLRVEVSRRVDNVFISAIGVDTTTVGRDSTSQFEGPVPMGSPENILGDDPKSPGPDFWLNVAAPEAPRGHGDRYAAKNCGGSEPNCTGSIDPQIPNDDYMKHGYVFVVRVPENAPDRDLRIQVYDGAYTFVNDRCGRGVFPGQDERDELAALPEAGAGLVERHEPVRGREHEVVHRRPGQRWCWQRDHVHRPQAGRDPLDRDRQRGGGHLFADGHAIGRPRRLGHPSVAPPVGRPPRRRGRGRPRRRARLRRDVPAVGNRLRDPPPRGDTGRLAGAGAHERHRGRPAGLRRVRRHRRPQPLLAPGRVRRRR